MNQRPVTIKNILRLSEFQNAEIISTSEGLNKEVLNITVMDLPNIDQWLKRDELLVIGFFMETHFTLDFIQKINERGGAGIITKKKFSAVITDEVKANLYLMNIPIILIDDQYSWSDILTPIQSLIIEYQTKILRQTQVFYKSMILALTNQTAMNSLCSIYFQVTNHSIAILDTRFNLLDHSSDIEWQTYLKNVHRSQLPSLTTIGINNRGQSIIGYLIDMPDLAYSLYLIPIYKNMKIDSYFAILSLSTSPLIPPEILATLETFESIYFIKKITDDSARTVNYQYQNMILDELLKNEAMDKRTINNHLMVLGGSIYPTYCVIIISQLHQDDTEALEEQTNRFVAFKQSLCRETILNDSAHVFFKSGNIVILYPEMQPLIDHKVKEIDNYLIDYFGHANFVIGISDYHPYEKSYIGFKEASLAVNILKSNLSLQRILLYKSLGVLQLFTDSEGKINQLFINKMIETYVTPIHTNDLKNNTELLHTLELFFNNNFSHLATSHSLFIHKNTLRARLKRIEDILGIHLNNADTLMNVHMALRLYQLTNYNES